MTVEPVCRCGYYMVQDHAGNWYCEGPDEEGECVCDCRCWLARWLMRLCGCKTCPEHGCEMSGEK